MERLAAGVERDRPRLPAEQVEREVGAGGQLPAVAVPERRLGPDLAGGGGVGDRQRLVDVQRAPRGLRPVPVELPVVHQRGDVDARLHVELLVRRAARGAVEPAADGEDGVADLFGIEPGAVLPPEQVVVRVDLRRIAARGGRLLVGGARHDEAVQVLDAPGNSGLTSAARRRFHELHRQPVEQFRV